MIAAAAALSSLPPGLRGPLLEEYRAIVQNFLERRWSPSELSGGRLAEIVHTILAGHAQGAYAAAPVKPANMVEACRALEKNGHVPRSFQILIPRLLPALYEIRNNRGVGHVGGDVDPNHMDAVAVLSIANWVMAELVRVFHGLKLAEAQQLVDALAERRMPLVWEGSTGVRRVLDPKLALTDQVLLLLAGRPGPVPVADVIAWIETSKDYALKLLRRLHKQRKVELSSGEQAVEALPPGVLVAEKIAGKVATK